MTVIARTSPRSAAPRPAAQQPVAVQQPVGLQPPPTDGFAVAALICAVLGLNLVAVILGHVSLAVIKRNGYGGTVMAVIALVIGYLSLVAIVLVILVAVGAIGWAVSLQ